MSFSIDVKNVTQVLLVDGWHLVKSNSFTVDTYDYVEGRNALLRGAAAQPSTGAQWQELDGSFMACPLGAILAVKWKAKEPAWR